MNFSNTIKFSGLCAFSNNNSFLAIVKSTSLIIYSTIDLKPLQKFTFETQISQIEWSPDSTLILCAFYKTNICEIKSITNPQFICTINEKSGIQYCQWTPDSRKILITNDFNARMSIWSLIDKSTIYINGPKFKEKGLTFSPNGYFMALIEKIDKNDSIGIYFTGDFSLVCHFNIDTFDAQDISWSLDSTSIACWDSSLENKLIIYTPTGNVINSFIPYNNGLGICNAKYSLNGHYLSVGFGDGVLRLYNTKTWKEAGKLNHNINVITQENLINVFKEEEIVGKKLYTKYVECSFPFKLNNVNKGVFGEINDFEWSYDSYYLASKNDSISNAIFIWQVNNLKLHTIIVQNKSIKDFKWAPNEYLLLIVTENEKLYTFTLNQVSLCDLISDSNSPLNANKIIWNKDGRCFIVCDKKQMMIGTKLDGDEEDNKGVDEISENEQKNNLENFNNMFNQINQNFNNENDNYNNNNNNDEDEEPQIVPKQYQK